MSSAYINDERMLSLITEQLNNVLDRAMSSLETLAQPSGPVGVCGFPCVGDCSTCTESDRNLQAFFAAEPAPAAAAAAEPISASIEGGNSAPVGEEGEDSALEVARAMDALEEAQRSGEAYEYEEDDDGYRGCHCNDCLNHDEPNWRYSYDDRDGYDDGYGLDWNESGYFD